MHQHLAPPRAFGYAKYNNAYTKALQRDPANGYALGQRADAYAALGDLDKATADRIAGADADVAANPDTASYYLVRANMMLDLSRIDDAIKDLDKVVSLEPKNATALADRAMARCLVPASGGSD